MIETIVQSADTPRIYFAGKIAKNDWRHRLGVDRLRDVWSDGCGVLDNRPWPMTPAHKHGLTFNYVGPYFVGDDHGCGHASGVHGVVEACCERAGELVKAIVFRRCREAIRSAHTVFAWVDSLDAFGTLWELGYAQALNRSTYLALGPTVTDDLWFARHGADHVIHAASPEEACRRFLLDTPPRDSETWCPSFLPLLRFSLEVRCPDATDLPTTG